MVTPHRVCVVPTCPDVNKPIGGQHKVYMASCYTLQRGVVPVLVVTVYCRGKPLSPPIAPPQLIRITSRFRMPHYIPPKLLCNRCEQERCQARISSGDSSIP